MLGNISIQWTPEWQWFTAGILACSAILIWWSSRQIRRWNALSVVGLSAKICGLALLIFILLEPVSIKKVAKPGINQIALIVDSSQTLGIVDSQTGSPIHQTFSDWFASQDGQAWIQEMSGTYKMRFYTMDSQPQLVSDPSDIQFRGTASSLNSGLLQIAQSYRDKPLAGLILMTDGIPTDAPLSQQEMETLPPTFIVPLAPDQMLKDARIEKVTIRESAFEDAPVEVESDTHVVGFSGQVLVCDILRTDGSTVHSQSEMINGGDFHKAFRASFKPLAKGIQFYKVRLRIAPAGSNPVDRPGEEITELNNSQWITMDHGQKPLRLLYVAGRPNWEFKFLNRAIHEDPLLEMAALIRIAKREPRFQFKGRTGETSNPLFRGFDKQDEETEKYDQPVLKRLNVRDEQELSDGFPIEEKELFVYDAIILDDIESAFFTRSQMGLIREFVSRRGGGLFMLGGMESMAEGNYQESPLKDVLPVYLINAPEVRLGDKLQIALTDEGWLEPWARIRSTQAAELSRRDELDPYLAANVTGRQKPGASVIATLFDENGNSMPALVAQRYGRGRSMSLALTDFWRPGMRNPEAMEDVKKAWRQMMRHLVSDVPQRLELALDSSDDLPFLVESRTTVYNKEYNPQDNARVKITVTPLGNSNETWEFETLPSNQRSGVLESSFTSREEGPYLVTAETADEQGIPLGTIQKGWVSNPLADEFRKLSPDREWMQGMAQSTGGQVVPLSGLPQLQGLLSKLDLPETQIESTPLWHQPWILASALILLLADWGIRRINGLP